MKNNYKKGFTLAEALMIFLLISVSLAALAPFMTRKAQKKVDESCVNGTKSKVIEYKVPGNYTFTAPENITGDSVITLVGAGGKGGNGDIKTYTRGKVQYTCYATGGAGGGGEYLQSSVALSPGTSYDITVGGGGGYQQNPSTLNMVVSYSYTPTTVIANGKDDYQVNTTFKVDDDTTLTAQRGANGADGVVAVSGESCTATGGAGGVQGGGTNAAARPGQKGGDGCGCPDCLNIGTCEEGGVGGGGSVYSAGITGGDSGKVCSLNTEMHAKPGSDYAKNSLSKVEFISGTGGGGAGVNFEAKTAGVGGMGGNGYAKIEYQVRCE